MNSFNGRPINLGDKLKVRLSENGMVDDRIGVVVFLTPILLYLDRPFGYSHNAAWEREEISSFVKELGLKQSNNLSWWLDHSTKILENLSYESPIDCLVCKRKVLLSEKKCWWCGHLISS